LKSNIWILNSDFLKNEILSIYDVTNQKIGLYGGDADCTDTWCAAPVNIKEKEKEILCFTGTIIISFRNLQIIGAVFAVFISSLFISACVCYYIKENEKKSKLETKSLESINSARSGEQEHDVQSISI
jgi:hypothetical protein